MHYRLLWPFALYRYVLVAAMALLFLLPGASAQTIYTKLFSNRQRESWYQLSVANKGNPGNMVQLMSKARKGQPITVAVIGGSITAGARSSNFDATAYGPLVRDWWQHTFPGAAVKFVNAGIGATNSVFGVHREERDLLVHHPDFVIIEFCVNDNGEMEAPASFEGLVRKLLKSNPAAAIMVVATMEHKGNNWQSYYLPVCRHYQLPMISYRDAIWPEVAAGRMTWKALSPDDVHPNDTGHAIIAGLVSRYLEDAATLPDTFHPVAGALPPPLTFNGYEHSTAYNAASLTPLSLGNWQQDAGLKGWSTSQKGAPLTFEVTGGYVGIMFKKTNKNAGATAYVIIDGKKRIDLDADFPGGWGDYMELKPLLHEPVKGKHTLAFYYNDERAGKTFGISDILVANY